MSNENQKLFAIVIILALALSLMAVTKLNRTKGLEAEVAAWKTKEAVARVQTRVATEHANKIEALCLTIVDVNKRYDETLNSLKNWLEVGNVKSKP